MSELNPVQIMILGLIENLLRTSELYAAYTALQIADLAKALPTDVLVEWTEFVFMSYNAEKARFDDRRAAELNYIIDGTYDAEMQEWHDTQASLEASVRL